MEIEFTSLLASKQVSKLQQRRSNLLSESYEMALKGRKTHDGKVLYASPTHPRELRVRKMRNIRANDGSTAKKAVYVMHSTAAAKPAAGPRRMRRRFNGGGGTLTLFDERYTYTMLPVGDNIVRILIVQGESMQAALTELKTRIPDVMKQNYPDATFTSPAFLFDVSTANRMSFNALSSLSSAVTDVIQQGGRQDGAKTGVVWSHVGEYAMCELIFEKTTGGISATPQQDAMVIKRVIDTLGIDSSTLESAIQQQAAAEWQQNSPSAFIDGLSKRGIAFRDRVRSNGVAEVKLSATGKANM